MTEATQFVVLSAARTGSTMLRQLLNSHPDICCHGEVMTGRSLTGFVGLERGGTPIRKKLLGLCRADPPRFLADFVLYPGGARAVGFKVKYEELAMAEHGWLLSWLAAHRELKVVHLRRENRLKRLVSEITAVRHHGVYNITSEAERPAPVRITLTAAACLEDFAAMEARERTFRERFRHHAVLETSYEAIVEQRAGTIDGLAGFLGVAPALLTARTLKMNPDDVRVIVENVEELAAALRGTPYAAYLDPGPPG